MKAMKSKAVSITVAGAFLVSSMMGVAVISAFAPSDAGIIQQAEAKNGLKRPVLGKWKKTYDSSKDPNRIADGVTYTIKWKKVKGAAGYQVKHYESDTTSGKWYTFKVTTKKCKSSDSFSDMYKIGARVRAYKVVNGKKRYGKWSKLVVKKNVLGH